jgi:hypothetical protein
MIFHRLQDNIQSGQRVLTGFWAYDAVQVVQHSLHDFRSIDISLGEN